MLSEKFAHIVAFESKQLAFYVDSCGVACKGVVGSYYSVAGDYYGDGVAGYCVAYGLGGHGGNVVFGGYQLGKGTVGSCCAIGDIAEVAPDLAAEGGALGGEGEVCDGGFFAGEVEVEPVCGGGEEWGVGWGDSVVLGESRVVFLVLYV